MIGAHNFTIDSQPDSSTGVDIPVEFKLDDDAWAGTTLRPFAPFVYNYSEYGREPRFPLNGDWFYVEGTTGGEFYAVLEDKDYRAISDPILMFAGNMFTVRAAFLRIVAVKRAGHVRIVHGTGEPPVNTGLSIASEFRRVNLVYGDVSTWPSYESPDGDATNGVVRLSPTQCGLAGTSTSTRFLAPTSPTVTTTHYEFLFYGVAQLAVNQDLIGVVSGGIYVKEFMPLVQIVGNGAASSNVEGFALNGMQSFAVYYRLTAAGVTAGAVPPDRKFSGLFQRSFLRQQGPYSVAG